MLGPGPLRSSFGYALGQGMRAAYTYIFAIIPKEIERSQSSGRAFVKGMVFRAYCLDSSQDKP